MQAKALGCDSTTPYWWAVQSLMDGTSAVQIDDGNFALVHPTLKFGLSTLEQGNVLSRSDMGVKLPDIISNTTFKARFTTAKKTAIVNFFSSHPGANQTVWNRILAGGDIDLQDITVQNVISALRGAGVLTDADVAKALASQTLP
jgi:hypothetical protein